VRFVPKPLWRTADISRGTQSRRAFLTNCVLVMAFFLAVYVVLGMTADLVAGYIPDRHEAKLFSAGTAASITFNSGTSAKRHVSL